MLVCVVVACSSSDDAASPDSGDAGGGLPASGEGGGGGGAALPPGCTPAATTYAGFAQDFFATRCAPCHLASSTGDARLGAPPEVSFSAEDDIAFWQARIRVRALQERTMPLGAPLSECDAAHLASYLDALDGAGACEPACAGKDCGTDGCGGSCGQCADGLQCAASGACVDASCQSMCEGIACGDDGCGGSCGECGPSFSCSTDGTCTCAPQCSGKSCGDDGCGGSCGSCSGADVCTADGQCLCIPQCSGLACGDDGCGGPCGTCMGTDLCATDQTSCETCVPDCTGKACGDDGCGGFCPDTCTGPMKYCDNAAGTCKTGMCRDKCGARECGYVGCAVCGSNGGACTGGDVCNADGMCACAPDCVGKACGDDGCSGQCGTCADGLTCDRGQCGCTADCAGRECGSDGCGGTCGPNEGVCDGGMSCSSDGQCTTACVPDCSGKSCGGDGCGGTCGGCAAGQSCDGGGCVSSGTATFSDVYAIFQQKNCGRSGCHGGAKPAQNLDLSTEAKALAGLVDVASDQCSGKKRVLPGDATQSYLVNKLTGSGLCSGSQMPKGGTALNNTQLDTVRAWIDAL